MKNKKLWEELTAYFLWYNTDRIENDASNISFGVAYVLIAAVTFLPNNCLATRGGYTYRHTDWWEEFMKYGVEMDSGVKICMPSFMKNSLAIQKLKEGIHRQHGDRISLLLFFK
jgi:hypothetical protein